MAIFSVIVITGGMSWKTGMQYCRDNFAILETEITNARGSLASTAARLAVSLNNDGTLKAAQSTPVDWKTSGYTCTKVDADTFRVTNPATTVAGVLYPGRAIMFNADGTAIYGTIKSSAFSVDHTDVDLFTTNVPATITQLDYAIIHVGDEGSLIPVEPIATKPAYVAKYACRFLLAIDTGIIWVGNPITGAFEPVGGGMLYKDFANSAAKGGTGITVTQAGGAVTTRLDFNTPSTLSGRLTSLVVAGQNRAAITSNDFDVQVFTKTPGGTWTTDVKYCVFEAYNLNGTLKPFGLVDHSLNIAVVNDDGTTVDSLWVKITNNLAADSSVFDIEATVEYMPGA